MKTENAIKDKSFSFALRVVKCYKYLRSEQSEYVLSKQFLRSGTAIGALVREAEKAESKPDFIHKLSISLKEANETEYWLELLYQSQYIDKSAYESIYADCKELIKLLTSNNKDKQEKLTTEFIMGRVKIIIAIVALLLKANCKLSIVNCQLN